MTAPDRLLEVLRCVRCGARLSATGDQLTCLACGHAVPIVNGIPRFVTTPSDEVARRTQASFGYEWTEFSTWELSGETNFAEYFAGVDLSTLRDARVLDAGCGMGRHARQLAPHVRHVVAVDFSAAIDQAARNCAPAGNVDCVQADLLALPLAEAAFDYVYSMGVLHHLADTEDALARVVRCARPGGRVRIYLYWQPHGWRSAVLGVVSALRRVTTRMPFPLLKAACAMLSVLLWVLLILPYRVLLAAGVRGVARLPLAVYVKYPFAILYNDQFDRFSAPIEKRYDPDEVMSLMQRAGLTDVTVRPAFGWLAEGTRPPEAPEA